MTTEFLTRYAGERIAAFRYQAWADSQRPSHHARIAQLLTHLAARLEPDPTSSTRRKAY